MKAWHGPQGQPAQGSCDALRAITFSTCWLYAQITFSLCSKVATQPQTPLRSKHLFLSIPSKSPFSAEAQWLSASHVPPPVSP